MVSLTRWFNDARIRSILAGASGGIIGWCIAEGIVRRPDDMLGNLAFGLIVGLGIGAALGAAEGLAIQSWRTLQRGLFIGLMMGAAGGAVGALAGQIGYQLAAASPNRQGSSVEEGGTHSTPASGGIFNPRVREIQRRVEQAGGSQGEIEIALGWNNTNDLDLHVIDPNGFEIYFGKSRSPSGGWLDIDKNAGCGSVTATPVEHVFWSQTDALQGQYRIYVNHYAACEGADPTAFDVVVTVGDQVTPIAGTIRRGDPKLHVHSFEYGTHLPAGEEIADGPDFPFLAVVFGWTIFGALVGCGQGVTRGSITAVRNTAIGGGLGGLIGGLVLVAIVLALGGLSDASLAPSSHQGWLGRLLGFVILGACIGFWSVLIDRALTAALTVVSGRFEGREILLDRPEMRIGRMETLEVYLSGDPQIASHHATISQEGDRHVLRQEQKEIVVNGTSASTHDLCPGDRITLGQTRLVYRHKAVKYDSDASSARERSPAPPRTRPTPPPPPPLTRNTSTPPRRSTSDQAIRSSLTGKTPSSTRSADGPTRGQPPPPPPPPPPTR